MVSDFPISKFPIFDINVFVKRYQSFLNLDQVLIINIEVLILDIGVNPYSENVPDANFRDYPMNSRNSDIKSEYNVDTLILNIISGVDIWLAIRAR